MPVGEMVLELIEARGKNFGLGGSNKALAGRLVINPGGVGTAMALCFAFL